MEIIQAIALLCQLSGDNLAFFINQKQLECQQYYIKCIGSDGSATYKILSKCIQERKL
jgi:hypothetical protein